MPELDQVWTTAILGVLTLVVLSFQLLILYRTSKISERSAAAAEAAAQANARTAEANDHMAMATIRMAELQTALAARVEPRVVILRIDDPHGTGEVLYWRCKAKNVGGAVAVLEARQVAKRETTEGLADETYFVMTNTTLNQAKKDSWKEFAQTSFPTLSINPGEEEMCFLSLDVRTPLEARTVEVEIRPEYGQGTQARLPKAPEIARDQARRTKIQRSSLSTG